MAAVVRKSSVIRADITIGPIWSGEDDNLENQIITDTAERGDVWSYDIQEAVTSSNGTVSFTLDSSTLSGVTISFGFVFGTISNTAVIGTVYELVITATDNNGSSTITIELEIVPTDDGYGGGGGQQRSGQSLPTDLEQYFKDLRRAKDEFRSNMGIRNRGSGMGIR